MYKALWNWERCRDRITTLRGRLGFPNSPTLKFLRLGVSLENGRIHDELRNKALPEIKGSVYCILNGYADAKAVPETFKLISFAQLPGGRSYYDAFIRRAVQPIEKTFGFRPQALYEAARLFGGVKLNHGDCSVKVYSLPLVPLSIVVWGATDEFSASANILFDSSASNYLWTEQLAMLCELTSSRLRHAHEAIT